MHWPASIAEGAAFGFSWMGYLFCVCLSCMQCCSQNYHLWAHRMPYPQDGTFHGIAPAGCTARVAVGAGCWASSRVNAVVKLAVSADPAAPPLGGSTSRSRCTVPSSEPKFIEWQGSPKDRTVGLGIRGCQREWTAQCYPWRFTSGISGSGSHRLSAEMRTALLGCTG